MSKPDTAMDIQEPDERLRRWRLVLGNKPDGTDYQLNQNDSEMDRVLSELYNQKKQKNKAFRDRFRSARSRFSSSSQLQEDKDGSAESRFGQKGSLESSQPDVARWLGDIREYFPAQVVQIMQQDAIDRIGLKTMLKQPEILEMIEPDIHLVSMLLTLKDVIPAETKATARLIVHKIVDQLMQRLENPLREAVRGALNRSLRNRRPKYREINWLRTIHGNLKHYQKDYQTVIPEQLIGHGHKRSAAHDVIICVDQSGSMASSTVYASIFGAVMASIPALKTHMIAFSTEVVDLTEHLHDPVDLLFGTMLGGGTNIEQALGYCQNLITRPHDTTLVLISDLFEGGRKLEMLAKARQIAESGVNFVALLSLSDSGTPTYDRQMAAMLSELDIPTFACTPDLFPDLMGATMNRRDLNDWASQQGIKTVKSKQEAELDDEIT